MKTVTENAKLSQQVGETSFLLTHFELEGPTCSVKKKDIEGTSEGDAIQRGDANGVEVPWVNPKLLNFKAKYKQRVYRLLDRFAVRRGPTYCFTEENYQKFYQLFADIKASYEAEADNFAINLDKSVDAYISAKPHLERFVRKHRLDAQDVRNRFRFDMAVPTVLQAHNDDEQGELVKEVEAGFWRQVADKSKDLLQSLAGREYGTQKTLGPIRSLAELMFNNSSLSPRVSMVGVDFWSYIDSLPKSGNVEGSEFIGVVRYLGLLASGECEQAFRENRMPVLDKSQNNEEQESEVEAKQPEQDEVSVQSEQSVSEEVSSEAQVTETAEASPVESETIETQQQDELEVIEEINVADVNPLFENGVNTLF